MIVNSFIRDGFGLRPVEVELTLTAGLPQMKFLGLPDALIRESEVRIRTALKNQGFELPNGKSVLVQLRPADIKKESRGLDLAVAAAYLWETEQLPCPEIKPYLYGELNFSGDVLAPEDVSDLETLQLPLPVLVGKSSPHLNFEHTRVATLKELNNPEVCAAQINVENISTANLEGYYLSKEQASLAEVVIAGEHSLLLAGPPGSGKTTLAEFISQAWIPDESVLALSRQIARYFGEELAHHPVRRPHHTATTISVLGGGRPPEPGEITRAHGGILIMDEFLEFSTDIQEGLREPLEGGNILISRAGQAKHYPARFQLIATTNLCKCGWLAPTKDHKCRCRNIKRRLYVERLSGPLLDRFQVVGLSHEFSSPLNVELTNVQRAAQAAKLFASKTRGQKIPNSKLSLQTLEKQVAKVARKAVPISVNTQRRIKNLLQVARTCADLELQEEIGSQHIGRALDLGFKPIQKLHVDLQKYI